MAIPGGLEAGPAVVPAGGGQPLVSMRGIRKHFGGVVVLQGVDFDVGAGEVHVLAGENGAGKSTLLKVLAGVHPDYEGEIRIGGRVVRPRSPQEAARLGVAVIHQELSLVPAMSVADNLCLGRHPGRHGLVDRRGVRREASRLLALVGLADVDPQAPVESLPLPAQQLVEIAKALGREAQVLVMDEPTSALTAAEVDTLFGLIARLRSEGRGLVFVSHRLEEIERMGDRVTVLRDGCSVASGPIAEFPARQLIEHMLGRPPETAPRGAAGAPGGERLTVRGFCVFPRGFAARPAVHDVALAVRSGEILGIAGLQGSGASELLGGLFGVYGRWTRGVVAVDGREVRITSPRQAVRHGLALLPKDRKASGLVLGASVVANATLAWLDVLSRGGFRRPAAERAATAEYAGQLGLRARSLDDPVAELSGGNQQKVVFARWLMTGPKILLLDEPTRGIDVGAKAEIYRLMDAWRGEGMAIVLITSELPELLMMSDRILVLHRGQATAMFDGRRARGEEVLAAAMGRSGEEAPA